MRVLAAMSGGVDSAVAAARAVDAGHDVVGVHLALSRAEGGSGPARARGCCTVEDAHDARRAADVLGIPFYVWDLSEQFAEDVVADFVAAYAAGRTPNPCVRCNERIKFAALLDRALALGFDAVATGHWARLEHGPDGPRLRRAADAAKDQSYVLASVAPERLGHVVLPVGDTPDKALLREEAAARGLAVAAKPDSHDICFVPDGDTPGWLSRRLGDAAGPVVDTSGTVVGRHEGTHRFTVGQRRGLHLDRPAPDGRPRYVLSLEPVTRTVTVGSAEDLLVAALAGTEPVWHGAPPAVGSRVEVQVRAHARPVAVTVEHATPDAVALRPESPVPAVASGQLLAMYDDSDTVLGAARAA
ncbi:tRNA 2-thiouridine(34) synthase MnmA [Aquipuribacter nitratireducens]|uniref:tRNA-specific 2-thiouridylase MnmA n=1 Tax=Aquipuribacter nitratireducens TaxID=650104 RepID=A0ABW0GNV6_9MICO